MSKKEIWDEKVSEFVNKCKIYVKKDHKKRDW